MKSNNSTQALKHPYLRPENWSDGLLCFWRENPLYSKTSQDKMDAELSKWLENDPRVRNGQTEKR